MDWPTAPIGDLCQLINGRAFKPTEWESKGLPIVRIQNLNNANKPFNYYGGKYSEKHFIDTGEILLSWSGTPGTSFGCFRWQGGPGLLNQHIFKVLVDKEVIDGEFFIHAVNSRLEEMIAKAHGGVGLRHITKSKLVAIKIPIPELDEQRRIVARIKECMDRVDEIEILRQQSLDEFRSLEVAMFGAVAESSSWPLMSIGDLTVRTQNGRSIGATNENSNGFVLSLASVRGVELDASAVKPIILPENVLEEYPVSKDDVFVSRANTRELVGLSSIVSDAVDQCIFPDLLIKLTPKPDIILPRYLAFSLRTPSSRTQIQDRASGTSQSMVKISGARLREVCIRVPPIDVQAEVIERLNGLHDRIMDLSIDLNGPEVDRLRESILRKAFAGEL